MTKLEALNLLGDEEQIAAWTRAAGDKPLEAWLAEIADTAAAVKGEPTWPVVVKLRHPVDLGKDEHITELTFQRGKTSHIRGMALGEKVLTDQLITVAARLCGHPVRVIEELDVDDASEVMGIALRFFGKCLGGGKRR